jgi:hypothetical protein
MSVTLNLTGQPSARFQRLMKRFGDSDGMKTLEALLDLAETAAALEDRQGLEAFLGAGKPGNNRLVVRTPIKEIWKDI